MNDSRTVIATPPTAPLARFVVGRFARRASWLATAVLACSLPVVGGATCASDNDGGYPTNSRGQRGDEVDSRIPTNARLVAQGNGNLSFRATSGGTLYVYDVTDRDVKYNVDLLEADTFRMVAEDDRVFINGGKGEKVKLQDENKYRLYFDGRRGTYGGGGYGGGYGRDRDSSDRDGRDNRESREPTREVRRAVPDNAKPVDEARGRDLSFKAGDDGKAYLYDVTNEKLVQTYSVRRGQRLTISPASDAVAIDGKTVAKNQSFDRRTTYRLLFSN